jgi:hypothetical protein
LARIGDKAFNYTDNVKELEPKLGACQQYVNCHGTAEDYGPGMFAKSEVERIALLDLRILNMDRNTGNILVGPNKQLIPIDHGLSLPDSFSISEYDMCWMSWGHIKDEMSQDCRRQIDAIDIDSDVEMLSTLFGLRDKCLRNFKIANIVLKK